MRTVGVLLKSGKTEALNGIHETRKEELGKKIDKAWVDLIEKQERELQEFASSKAPLLREISAKWLQAQDRAMNREITQLSEKTRRKLFQLPPEKVHEQFREKAKLDAGDWHEIQELVKEWQAERKPLEEKHEREVEELDKLLVAEIKTLEKKLEAERKALEKHITKTPPDHHAEGVFSRLENQIVLKHKLEKAVTKQIFTLPKIQNLFKLIASIVMKAITSFLHRKAQEHPHPRASEIA